MSVWVEVTTPQAGPLGRVGYPTIESLTVGQPPTRIKKVWNGNSALAVMVAEVVDATEKRNQSVSLVLPSHQDVPDIVIPQVIG